MNETRRKPAYGDDSELRNKNPPTPCLWQAPARTQKTKREARPSLEIERHGGISLVFMPGGRHVMLGSFGGR